MIKLKNISKIYKTRYESVKALDNVNVTLPDNGLFCLIGKSGSGKSTLLNLIGGLDYSNSGDIFFNNICLNDLNREEIANYRNEVVGFVFQEFNLLDNLTVYENIKIALDLQNQDDEEKIDVVLKDLDIENLKNRQVVELSGGQKARVAIARAIVKNPQIILADEPTGNLDQKNSDEVWKLLKEISKKRLVLVASHDKNRATIYADSILNIVDGLIKVNHSNVNEQSNYYLKDYEYSNNLIKFLSKKVFKTKNNLYLLVIITMTMAMFFFGFSIMLTQFELNESYAEALVNNHQNNITIVKNDDRNSYTMGFNVSERNYLKSFLQNYNYSYGSNLIVNNEAFTFTFKNTDNITEYYKFYNNSSEDNNIFVDLKENKFNYIGNLPKGANELMISNFLADYIIRLGVNNVDNQIIEINNYNDLLNQEILVNDVRLKIVGIYLVDEDIKNKDTLNNDDENIIMQYLYRYYINSNFFEISNFNSNSYTNMTLGLKYNDNITINYISDENINLKQIIIGNDLAKEQSIIKGDKIKLQLWDLYDLYNMNDLSYELEVIDIGNLTIINKNLLNNVHLNHQLVKEIYVNNASKIQLKNLFSIDKKHIEFKTIYSNDMANINLLVSQVKTIFTFLGCIFALVNILIIIVYIHFVFKSNKDKILTLYSLGIKDLIIKKIFIFKSLMLGLITLLMTYLLITISIILGNLIISYNLGYTINIIRFNYSIYLYPFLLISVIILLAIIYQMLMIKGLFKKRT